MEYTAAEAILQPDHTPAGEKKSPSFSPLTGNPQKVSKKTTKHRDFHNVALKKQRQCIKLLQNRIELLKKTAVADKKHIPIRIQQLQIITLLCRKSSQL